MRKLALLAALAPVLLTGMPSAGAASITVSMRPTFRPSLVEFAYVGAASGQIAGPYVVTYAVNGTIVNRSVTTVVNDRGEGLVLASRGLKGRTGYPLPPGSDVDVALTYRIWVVAASGVPIAGCVGVVTRHGNAAPSITGDC